MWNPAIIGFEFIQKVPDDASDGDTVEVKSSRSLN